VRREVPRQVRRATDCENTEVESDQVRVRSARVDDVTLRSRLEQAWDVGFVADITLTDGTNCSAVLIAMSSTGLILDHWDGFGHAPAGDPFMLELSSIAEVVVP
jgi:hypothetical protein